ncbi:MAG: efflux RND transporter permease subunit [Alphaproteobacteria bacterium]|nr:efflux RND transporter permease subunit [Alphaproteobacteria bacterium]
MIRDASARAIRNPIPPIVLFLVMMAVGWVGYQRLPINNMPAVEIPIVAVTVAQAGSAPADLEVQVTRRVESAVAGVSNVRHVTSTVTDGQSVTVIEFQIGIPIDRAVDDVRDAISRVRTDLPRAIEEPVIRRVEMEANAIVTYAVAVPGMSLEDMTWFVDDVLVRSLQTARGVARVQRQGGVDREIRVALDADRMAALGISAADINQQMRALIGEQPGGRADFAERETSIRALGRIRTPEALAEAPIALPGGRWARLSDLATVTDGSAEPRQLARYNGEPVIAVSVFRAKSASEVGTLATVEARLAEVQAAHPSMQAQQVQTTVDYTLEAYDASIKALIEGALLTVLVVWWFLRDPRATLVAAIAIPLSVIPTFAVLLALGFSLNGVSLLALSLAAGILVDDAIVEIENIVRHARMGKTAYQAALDAADEIGLAVVATTLVIVVVFLPVSFMGGVAGQYFREFGITVAVAVLFSLLVARLITPMMAAYFLKPHHAEEPEPGWVTLYARLLSWSLRHRGITVVAGAGVLVGSVLLVPLLPTGFLPPSDREQSVLSLEMPPGTSVADVDRTTREITRRLLERPDVRGVYTAIGGSALPGDGNGLTEGDPRRAALTIRLTPRNSRPLSQRQIEGDIRALLASIPDIRANFAGEFGTRDVQIVLTGDSTEALNRAALELERQMRGLSELANVIAAVPLERPELRIEPKLDEAAAAGVSLDVLGQIVRIATMGDIDANLAKLELDGRRIPVRVQLQRTDRDDLQRLARLVVPTASGRVVPLDAVATVRFGAGDATVSRFDRRRQVRVEADLAPGIPLGQATAAIRALPILAALPPGVAEQAYGDVQVMEEMFAQFGLAMGAGVLLVFAVLTLLFGTLLQPLTIMLALPLSIGGAVLALLITQNALSLPAMIGILMLLGIVGKNSILLVEMAIETRSRGVERNAAMLEAGRTRARPIVMTTIAMVAGMVPLLIGLHGDTAFRAPMAVTVIGGLIASTLLSLVFVPVAYTLVDDFEHWLAPRLVRWTGLTLPSETNKTRQHPAE